MCGDMGVQRVLGHALGKGLCALSDPEAFKKDALRGDASVAGRCGCEGKLFKIDVCCQICLAGGDQRIGFFMPLQRLQGIAQTVPVAIIHDQRGTAVGRDPFRHRVEDLSLIHI